MTHPADESNRPAAQTEETGDGSMLQLGLGKSIENVPPPMDRSYAGPPQSPGQQEAPVGQGTFVLTVDDSLPHQHKGLGRLLQL